MVSDRTLQIGVAVGQGLILALLFGVVYLVQAERRDPPPMARCTEWTTESGRIERLQTHMEEGETIASFFARHTVAVKQAGGPGE